MVQVPSVGREDARRTHRERQRLVAERVQHVNRIKGGVAKVPAVRRTAVAKMGPATPSRSASNGASFAHPLKSGRLLSVADPGRQPGPGWRES